MNAVLGKKREEKKLSIDYKHILASIIILILLIPLMIFYEREYIFEKPDYQICRDMCEDRGYYDGYGINYKKVPGQKLCHCWDNTKKESYDVGIIE